MASAKRAQGFEEERQRNYETSASEGMLRRQEPRERIRLGAGGRFVVPASMRAAMNVQPGDTLIAHVEDGELRVISARNALRRVQDHMARYKQPDESIVDEFLLERRAMWGEE